MQAHQEDLVTLIFQNQIYGRYGLKPSAIEVEYGFFFFFGLLSSSEITDLESPKAA